MIKYILLLCLVSQSFFNCQNKPDNTESIQAKLSARLDSSLKNADSCFFRLKDLTKFEWGRLYIFRAYLDESYISSVLAFNYHSSISDYVPHYYERFIFTHGTKVIHEEDIGPIGYGEVNINVFLPIDTMSFSKASNVFTRQMHYFNSSQDSIVAYRTGRDTIGRKGNSYFLQSVRDINRHYIID
jgi:hypothetical protein